MAAERSKGHEEDLRSLTTEVDDGRTRLEEMSEAVRQLDGRLRAQEAQSAALAQVLAITSSFGSMKR